MLLLERHVGEWITIEGRGIKIRVKLARIRTADKAYLGIEAPPEMVILRDELIGRPPEGGPGPEIGRIGRSGRMGPIRVQSPNHEITTSPNAGSAGQGATP